MTSSQNTDHNHCVLVGVHWLSPHLCCYAYIYFPQFFSSFIYLFIFLSDYISDQEFGGFTPVNTDSFKFKNTNRPHTGEQKNHYNAYIWNQIDEKLKKETELVS